MLQLGLVLSTGLVHCKHLTLHWYVVLYRASQGLMIVLGIYIDQDLSKDTTGPQW